MRRIWVDFNDLHRNRLTTLRSGGPEDLSVDERVLGYDGDGTERQFIVTDLTSSGLAYLQLAETLILPPTQRGDA